MKRFTQVLQEAKEEQKPVVMAFGRMNPPTVGHEKLVNKVKELAEKHGAPHHVVLSHSQDAKKNPLSAEDKLTHAKRLFPKTNLSLSSKESPTFLHKAAELHRMGHTHLIMVAGDDRIAEYKKKLQQYNGTHPSALFNFKKIEVKSSGARDPDSDGPEGISASRMRTHAQTNNFYEFRKGIPPHVPEKHAKALMKDVRKGMGINESECLGMFKCIFVCGGPGSGKDVIIREAISSHSATEYSVPMMVNLLKEETKDYRQKAINCRQPLVITCTSSESHEILGIKEHLEEMGYETSMIFVNTTDAISKVRNMNLTRMLEENVRRERWKDTQVVLGVMQESFDDFLVFDNSLDITTADTFEITQREDEISDIYEHTLRFLSTLPSNPTAQTWLKMHGKLDIEAVIEQALQPYLIVSTPKRTTNFSKDADTKRAKKQKAPDPSKVVNGTGAGGSEYSTRGSGTVYPMSGMGSVTYSEGVHKYRKTFGEFRESVDSPSVEMGVTGGYHGPSNKEPLQTYQDKVNNLDTVNKKKKGKRNVQS